MRGLDYYTGTVFEVYDTNPENARALFGGGRYDGLVNLFGADPISALVWRQAVRQQRIFWLLITCCQNSILLQIYM